MWGVQLEPEPCPASSSRKERPALPKSASIASTQGLPHLQMGDSSPKTNELIKGVRHLIWKKRKHRAVDAAWDVDHGFGDTLDPLVLDGIEQYAVEERTYLVDEE